jgi:tRNA1Val (adenine37-N6)-methyltransferase
MSQPFQFKKFQIAQDRCAMKVGTDGVLLGAWAPVEHKPFSILDIGAGSGLIALMLAQRTHAEIIDAIEIDAGAYEQCVENFEASPWNDRLFCYHASLKEFVDEIDDRYDLIVSNPPFYTENYTSGNHARDAARQSKWLPPEVLFDAVSGLLASTGVFALIVPFKEENNILQLAQNKQLYPFDINRIKGTPDTKVKRSLIAFSFKQIAPKISDLTIENSRHHYTDAYVALTGDFYLKM